MIYTITLNPSIDYIVEVDDLKLGGLNRMNRDLKLPGGKGINVSRILNQLGAANTAIGFLGGFTGRFINDKPQEDAIQTDFVTIADDTRINIKLKHGDETEINGLGPAIRADEAEQSRLNCLLCKKEILSFYLAVFHRHLVQISMIVSFKSASRRKPSSSLIPQGLH